MLQASECLVGCTLLGIDPFGGLADWDDQGKCDDSAACEVDTMGNLNYWVGCGAADASRCRIGRRNYPVRKLAWDCRASNSFQAICSGQTCSSTVGPDNKRGRSQVQKLVSTMKKSERKAIVTLDADHIMPATRKASLDTIHGKWTPLIHRVPYQSVPCVCQ